MAPHQHSSSYYLFKPTLAITELPVNSIRNRTEKKGTLEPPLFTSLKVTALLSVLDLAWP